MPFPDLTLTNVGATRLLQAGVLPTHLQYSSAMIAAADLAAQATVAGVLATVSVTEAVVANESQFIGVDDTDANAYTTFRCVALWHVPDGSNPGDTGSVLLAIDSTGNNTTYGDKVANIDLIVSGSLRLTDAQAANITFGSGTVLQATEARHGTTRYSTDDEDDAGARNDRSSTPKGTARYVAAWWNALTSATLFAKLPRGNPAQDAAGTSDTVVARPLGVARYVAAWWTALSTVSLRNKLVMATAQQARAGTGTGVMTSELTTEHFGARIKIQNMEPVSSDGDSALSQIWLVHP